MHKTTCDFIVNNKQIHNSEEHLEFIGQILSLLQHICLEKCYQEANAEISNDFEITTFDGLE